MRHVLVAGATGALGRAIGQSFARNGDRVTVLGGDAAACQALARELGEGHRGYGCDPMQAEALPALLERIAQERGPIEVLVNIAASPPSESPAAAMDMAALRAGLAADLTAPFVLARELAKGMAQRRKGVILNTIAQAGAASRAALLSLTRALAVEWAAHGLRVNALVAGPLQSSPADAARLALLRHRIPMGRLGRPEDVAAGLLFLASDQARYVTGAELVVDGGWQAFAAAGEAHVAEARPEPVAAAPSSGRRTVLVTGGASGIGEALCNTPAADGDRFLVLDRDAQAEAAAAALPGEGHLPLQADITDETAVTNAFAALDRAGVAVDVLVNNAGIADSAVSSLTQSAEAFSRVVDVNLVGTMLCAREAVKRMQPRESGVILNLSSIVGDRPLPPRNAYSAAKAAVIALTRAMAAELSGAGLRVVAVAPGYVRTPLVTALGESGRIDIAALRKRIPLGDLAQPQDIAEAIRFLISPQASWITGTTLFVDGGWSAFGGVGQASSGEGSLA